MEKLETQLFVHLFQKNAVFANKQQHYHKPKIIQQFIKELTSSRNISDSFQVL